MAGLGRVAPTAELRIVKGNGLLVAGGAGFSLVTQELLSAGSSIAATNSANIYNLAGIRDTVASSAS